MSSTIIYQNGEATITVPAAESVAVYTRDVAKVYQVVGYPNVPDTTTLVGTVTNGQTVFGAYASGATLLIEAQADKVFYEVGSAPTTKEADVVNAPAALTVAATMTPAQLLGGLITGTHAEGGDEAYTLPTGANLDAAGNFVVGDWFKWTVINLSAAAADNVVVTANTGHTVVGVMLVPSVHATTGALYGSSATFLTRKTAADTFVTYRVS